MTIRFSSAEYWLLDMAFEFPVPMEGLPYGEASFALNRSDHKCSVEELIEGLERLFKDRFISSCRHDHTGPHRYLTRPSIVKVLSYPRQSAFTNHLAHVRQQTFY